MQTEIEAKFLDVDHDVLRAKLRELGATCAVPERLMRRQNYDLPQRNPSIWVRVRDEGSKITMSYKQMDSRSLHGTKEICLTIDSYEQGDALARAVGLIPTAYQETKRESWHLGQIEIDLDTWPWVRPYCEIEGPDEASVRDVVKQLGLSMDDATHGGVDIVYTTEYDISDDDINNTSKVTFEMPVPAAWTRRTTPAEVAA
jgi:adenylate cyclase class 2